MTETANMAAGAIAPPEWVYVGAPVLLLTLENVTGSVQAVRNAEVVSVAPKSCLVEFKLDGTLMQERIPLGSLITAARGDTRRVRLELVEVKSERGTMAVRLREMWRARTAAVRQARWAAEHPMHQEAVESAVRALGTWQAVLASGELDILKEKLEPAKSWRD